MIEDNFSDKIRSVSDLYDPKALNFYLHLSDCEHLGKVQRLEVLKIFFIRLMWGISNIPIKLLNFCLLFPPT